MEELLSRVNQWLQTNAWFSTVSLIFGILSVILAIVFYFKSQKNKTPTWALRSTTLIRGLVARFESLTMSYAGSPIENFTVAKLAFWNAGRETIRDSDVASADPLVVTIKDGLKVLDANVIYASNPANQFVAIVQDQKRVAIRFDFLDREQGGIVQILHTGTSPYDLELSGTIKGAARLRSPFLQSFGPSSTVLVRFATTRIMGFVLLMAPLMYAILVLATLACSQCYTSVDQNAWAIGQAIVFIVLIWTVAFVLLHRGIPNSFEKIMEES